MIHVVTMGCFRVVLTVLIKLNIITMLEFVQQFNFCCQTIRFSISFLCLKYLQIDSINKNLNCLPLLMTVENTKTHNLKCRCKYDQYILAQTFDTKNVSGDLSVFSFNFVWFDNFYFFSPTDSFVSLFYNCLHFVKEYL